MCKCFEMAVLGVLSEGPRPRPHTEQLGEGCDRGLLLEFVSDVQRQVLICQQYDTVRNVQLSYRAQVRDLAELRHIARHAEDSMGVAGAARRLVGLDAWAALLSGGFYSRFYIMQAGLQHYRLLKRGLIISSTPYLEPAPLSSEHTLSLGLLVV